MRTLWQQVLTVRSDRAPVARHVWLDCRVVGLIKGLTTKRGEVVLVAEVILPLTIRDLTREDLPACAWSGSRAHMVAIATALDRADRGEVEFLAACPPLGLPVGLGGIDYTRHPGAGVLWMLGVYEALRSCGIGTLLIGAAEQRIRARGLDRAELGVEDNNPRARALYERLGYVAYGSEPDGWNEVAEDGSVVWYETVCTLMRKSLRAPAVSITAKGVVRGHSG